MQVGQSSLDLKITHVCHHNALILLLPQPLTPPRARPHVIAPTSHLFSIHHVPLPTYVQSSLSPTLSACHLGHLVHGTTSSLTLIES